MWFICFVEITVLLVIEDNGIINQHYWRMSLRRNTLGVKLSHSSHTCLSAKIIKNNILLHILETVNFLSGSLMSAVHHVQSCALSLNPGTTAVLGVRTGASCINGVAARWEFSNTAPRGSTSAPAWDRVCTPFKLGLGPQHENRFCRIQLECQLWRR